MIGAVFADTLYWVARTRPKDPYKEAAERARKSLGHVRIVTSDEVLNEFLGHLSAVPRLREIAARMVREILANANVDVVPQTRDSFLRALEFYESRPDKGYSLTDCNSMVAMKQRGIEKVLTNDHHFTQEGFSILILREGQEL